MSTTDSRIIPPDQVAAVAERLRRENGLIVFTNGCFAAIHAGHVFCLDQCRRLGHTLWLAINSTESILRLKGERPIIPDDVRAKMLLTLADYVTVFDADTPLEHIRAIRPDVLVKGGTTGEIVGKELVESYGGRVVKVGAVPGISTTGLLNGSILLEPVGSEWPSSSPMKQADPIEP
jgi:D-beta-D-heptose 7-phosphate kinase/D-beta-D-heptose 1-phosphate adenosyltransferase